MLYIIKKSIYHLVPPHNLPTCMQAALLYCQVSHDLLSTARISPWMHHVRGYQVMHTDLPKTRACRSGVGLQERQESIARRLGALLVLLIAPPEVAGRAIGPHGSLDVVQSARIGLWHGPLQVRVRCRGLRQLCEQVLLPCWPLTLLHASEPFMRCTWQARHQGLQCGAHQPCPVDEQFMMSTERADLRIQISTHTCALLAACSCCSSAWPPGGTWEGCCRAGGPGKVEPGAAIPAGPAGPAAAAGADVEKKLAKREDFSLVSAGFSSCSSQVSPTQDEHAV